MGSYPPLFREPRVVSIPTECDVAAMSAECLTILVAEDDPLDAELLKRAMKRAAITGPVHFVKDGDEAIEYLQGHGRFADRILYPFPSVVLTDLKMPRRTGLELLDWLRKHPECRVLPAILMSGSWMPRDVDKAYHFGVNSYFRKPSTLDELTELMRLLKGYWSRTELPATPPNCE